MKKLLLILLLIFSGLSFQSCEKDDIPEKKGGNATVTVMHCTYCNSRNIKVFYPPSEHRHLPPSFTCNDCGESGTLKTYKQ